MRIQYRSMAVGFIGAMLLACGSNSPAGTGDAGPGGQGSSVVALATGEANPVALAVDATNVYWANADETHGAVRKVPIAGGTATTLTTAGYPIAVAVDSSFVYYADQVDRSVNGGAIRKVPIAGGAVITLATGISLPNGIAVDGTNVYYTDEQDGNGVQVLPTGGGTPTPLCGCNEAHDNTPQCNQWQGGVPSGGMAQDAANIYWADGAHVWSVSKGGGTATPYVSNDNGASQVAVSGGTVFWTNGGSVRSSAGGGNTLVANLNGSFGIAADSANIYFGVQNGIAHLGKVPLAGGADNSFATSPSSDSPNAIVLDSSHVYWVGSDNITGGVYRSGK